MNVFCRHAAARFHIPPEQSPEKYKTSREQGQFLQCLNHSLALSNPKNPAAPMNPAISQRIAFA